MSERLYDDEFDDQIPDDAMIVPLELALTVREVRTEDLVDLGWSGGPSHIDALATALQRSYAGEVELIMITARTASRSPSAEWTSPGVRAVANCGCCPLSVAGSRWVSAAS